MLRIDRESASLFARSRLISTIIRVLFLLRRARFGNIMPIPFVIIEFPYRLLMFSCVFGSIVVGLVLHNASKHGGPVLSTRRSGIGALTQFYNFTDVPTAVSHDRVQRSRPTNFLMHDYWEAWRTAA